MDYPKETALINDRAKLKLARDLGDTVLSVLTDPRTIELMLNADGKLWQERLGEPMHCFGRMEAAQAQSIIRNVAGMHGKELTGHSPTIECEFPLDGSRFAGQIPPVVPRAVFAIRKRAVVGFHPRRLCAGRHHDARAMRALSRRRLPRRANILVSAAPARARPRWSMPSSTISSPSSR